MTEKTYPHAYSATRAGSAILAVRIRARKQVEPRGEAIYRGFDEFGWLR